MIVHGHHGQRSLAPGVFVLRADSRGTLVSAEGSPRSVLGMDAAELPGRSIDDVFRDRPQLVGAARRALGGEAVEVSDSLGERSLFVRFEPGAEDDGRLVGWTAFGVVLGADLDERAEDRLDEVQRVAHIGSWEWDAIRNVVTWTDELYRIYGLEKGEFAGTYESFMERVHPDDREHTRDVIFDAFRCVKVFVYDHRIVRPDGAVRLLHTSGDVIADATGRPVRLVGCCWDVTERWEAQRQLDRSLSLLQATLDSTEDGIFAVDLEGQIVSVNQRALSLWNIPERLAATRDVMTLVDHVRGAVDDPEAFARNEEALLQDRETARFDTIRFKDGRVFERYSQPQRIGDEVVGRVCSFRDVTERERLLRNAVFLSDSSRLLASMDIEQALEAVARASLPHLGEACAVDLFTESGGPRRLLALSLPQAEPATAAIPPGVLAGNPTMYTAGARSCIAVPIRVRGAVAGVLTFVAQPQRRFGPADLDLVEKLGERAALAIENARLLQRSREALNARDEFFAIASHEIRGPIAALHLAVQNLLRAQRDAGTTAKLVSVVERADRRLARFVDDLFDVSLLRAGPLHFDLREVDLGEVARKVITRCSQELTASGSSLSMTTQGALVGMWDRARVEQVVANLISNSIKFGLGRPIEVHIEGDEATVRLRVRDHGIGIAEERREAIFRPFERAVTARHYGGLGLGLFIARSVVEALGGEIGVESQGGQGSTTFTVVLPKERSRGSPHC